ncbi:uncharacterized protein MONOS_10899 [Monocercomonoides exilis]|uniref:uncharacterized protein n=1 Tax=Monocercomonoides exilis TaxID=2049356 RepID=UPI003559ABD2|nr:hypothetical protein MONOS_10899 [Monocercomonoides exilis]|eukprot:MONOS_10899.1-p1 / transcript=MONOS_10899.1 / gene=MONOS_10899 / organism=Monocercomonoides_exilis_PA203 / gene_product=unspecified product / transcript_product=unspecified product / location=Mono_scaffold00516:24098-24481(+) / protein_length=82 / sequence_SO=supercontig / SO=protein_coding / is_pseudo=false
MNALNEETMEWLVGQEKELEELTGSGKFVSGRKCVPEEKCEEPKREQEYWMCSAAPTEAKAGGKEVVEKVTLAQRLHMLFE